MQKNTPDKSSANFTGKEGPKVLCPRPQSTTPYILILGLQPQLSQQAPESSQLAAKESGPSSCLGLGLVPRAVPSSGHETITSLSKGFLNLNPFNPAQPLHRLPRKLQKMKPGKLGGRSRNANQTFPEVLAAAAAAGPCKTARVAVSGARS